MADIETRSPDPSQEDQAHEIHQARQPVGLSPLGNVLVFTAHGIRPPTDSNYHTAFMQCRACCNCDSGCSYYGQGKFDSLGHYLGS